MRPKAWVGRINEASVGFSPSSPNGRSTEVYAAMTASNEPLPESLVGRRLGAYDVLAWLGAGGMGEVYRARDTKLKRDVALKILPAHVARDVERLARFEREARVLASLNHPHIATIYGVDETDGVRALILELVEGPTLAERLGGGPMPVREALSAARQIAEALDAAHEKGIVHRDLKPANIKVTPDGIVKVLDFGIAKMRAPDDAAVEASTVTTVGTRVGSLLGTAAYMSPEQARGQAVDKRSDIWAFGCVLYEMLTGRAAFAGETVTDTLAHVLEREPDWSGLPRTTPANVRHLLRRCLAKDAKKRLRDIGDVTLELEEPPESSPTAGWTANVRTLRVALSWCVGVAVVAAGVAMRSTLACHGHSQFRAMVEPFCTGLVVPRATASTCGVWTASNQCRSREPKAALVPSCRPTASGWALRREDFSEEYRSRVVPR
jgi:hypothetical protein